jgi:hypothetical protein
MWQNPFTDSIPVEKPGVAGRVEAAGIEPASADVPTERLQA